MEVHILYLVPYFGCAVSYAGVGGQDQGGGKGVWRDHRPASQVWLVRCSGGQVHHHDQRLLQVGGRDGGMEGGREGWMDGGRDGGRDDGREGGQDRGAVVSKGMLPYKMAKYRTHHMSCDRKHI